MSLEDDLVFPPGTINESRASLSDTRETVSRHLYLLDIEGPRAPVNGELRHCVLALLRRGERHIILNLARVSRIDAAGVGELVRAYNVAMAANSVLRIAQATAPVRDILERVGLFDILRTGWRPD